MDELRKNWRLQHTCFAVFFLSFCVFAIHPEAALWGRGVAEGGEVIKVARSLAFHGTFADPFIAGRTGESAHVAPVYPFLLAIFLRIFGTGYGAQILLWALTVAMLSLQMAALPWITDRLGLGAGAGVAAAVLGAVSLHFAIDGNWECYLVGLMMIAVAIFTWRAATVGSVSVLGAAWGVLILANPVCVLLFLAWPPVLWPRRNVGLKFAAMSLGALAVISPWLMRNYERFDAFIFVRDDLGLELAISNNSCAPVTMEENTLTGCFHSIHPNSNPAVAKRVAQEGEVEFNREKLRDALTWIQGNRMVFAKLTARRVRQFWFPSLYRTWEEPAVWVVTVLAWTGIVLLYQERRVLALMLGITWLLFPVVYYVLASEPRYRYPIYWTMLLPAGFTVIRVYDFVFGRGTSVVQN